MEKRGQVTIFVIIAIVIVAGVILVLSANENTRDFILGLFSGKDDKVVQVNNYVTNCLKESATRALFYNGLQGGYFTTPDNSIFYQSDNFSLSRDIPYYLDKIKIIPSKKQLEKELNDAIANEIKSCLDLESEKLQLGVNLTYNTDNLSVNSILSSSTLKATLSFPIYIDIDSKKVLLDNYDIQEKTDYLILYSVAVQLTDIQLENGNNICISCILDLTKKNNLILNNKEAEGVKDNERIIIYQLIKEDSDKQTEIFSFAHKFYKT